MSGLTKQRYSILCIDDNSNNLFTLNALLATLDDIECHQALDAKSALDILLKQHVDLILCDVQMPDINGFELAKMIKSNKKTKHIPIVFVTAVFKSEEFIKQGFEMGAVDYITKPIDDNQLLNKITLYLKVFEQKNHLAQSEKKFYDIAQSIGDGIYTLDIKHKATFINKEALSLLGFKEEELLGKVIHDYIHYKDIDSKVILANECKVHNSMHMGTTYKNDNEFLIKKDGSFLSVSMTVTPLYSNGSVIGSVTVFSDNTSKNKIQKLEHDKIENQEQIIHSMIEMIESRDSYTAGHTRRVALYCELIARQMNYASEDIELLKNAAWLHDIGKIATPDSILLKPGKLDGMEYELIQEHLNAGYEMLKKIDQYKPISEIMREHHERFDGSGYPQGLKDTQIRPLSRIMIVADAFDAMTTNRVYKARKSVEEALEEMENLSAVHFHPDVVSVAIHALKDVKIDEGITQLPQTGIEEQRFSYFYRDRLTNLFVIDYLEPILRYYIEAKNIYMYCIRLKNFTEFNKVVGWKKGDDFLVDFAKCLNEIKKENIVFRIEGDDFMMLSENKMEDINDYILNYIKSITDILGCEIEEVYLEDVHSSIQEVLKRF